MWVSGLGIMGNVPGWDVLKRATYNTVCAVSAAQLLTDNIDRVRVKAKVGILGLGLELGLGLGGEIPTSYSFAFMPNFPEKFTKKK